jgi:hypothetical protein
LAILGTILVDQLRTHVTDSLISQGVPPEQAAKQAARISESQAGHVGPIPHFVRLDFAYATRTVFFVMAGIMAVAAIVARVGLQRGRQSRVPEQPELAADAAEDKAEPQPR